MEARHIGIDLGSTNIKSVVMDSGGGILERNTVPTDENWAERIKEVCDVYLSEYNDFAITVGMSCPGLVASDDRSVASLPNRLEGIEGFDWSNFLEVGIPVFLINDAHSALLAEMKFGAARGMKNVYMLVIGTGVGGAICIDGKIVKGHIGRASHLGHICLDVDGEAGITGLPGSIEDQIGNHNIGKRSGGKFATTHEMLAAFAEGNPDAKRIWLKSIRSLACAVASLNNVLDPEAVIIGGGIGKAGEYLLGPLQKELENIEWRPLGEGVPLISAQFDEWAGAMGAAIRGME